MSLRILGLSVEPFRHLFGMNDADMVHHRARRVVADACPGFPDRIELRDAEPGESLLLVNHVHLPADNPYQASHAIFVREGAGQTYDCIGEIPQMLRTRLISLRAFDAEDTILDADVIDGSQLGNAITRFLDVGQTAYLHAHFAKRGCYAARIERAP